MSVLVQNVNLHLVDQGSGIPTLFLHGNPDSADMWQGVIKNLSKQYRCLAPDLPGFGRTKAPADFDYSLTNMASFIAGLVDFLHLDEPLNLVTHDLGTSFGLAWAVKNPGRVRRIAVSNAIFFSDYRWHFWGRVWRTPLLGEMSMLLMNWMIFRIEMQRSSRRLTLAHQRSTYAMMSAPTRRMILRLYRASTPANFAGWEDDLLTLTSRIPTCILWGDHDPYLPSKYAERYGAQQVHHFPDCGHWLPAEAAEEASNRLTRFFA